MTDAVQGMDNILGYLEGISDERDSVPLLLAVRDQWPLVKTEIERLRTENACLRAAQTPP
jgi:hypothetical protein